MAPFATDAKHTVNAGTPTYGFSPLRLDPAESFLARFHGVDERVSLAALRFGLPVLYDVVRRFCACDAPGPGGRAISRSGPRRRPTRERCLRAPLLSARDGPALETR
jgi:hypothetical protein